MKLFCRKYGSGPPLIILHGLYGSSDNWATIAKKIGDQFTVYLPDLRNHGFSPHNDKHDYASLRDDIYELTEELNLEKIFLAGHSMGGKVAASFALKWPERLHGLLIADISPFADAEKFRSEAVNHMEILNSMLAIDLAQTTSRENVEAHLSEMIKMVKVRGVIMKNLKRNDNNSFSWKLNAPALLLNLENIMSPVAIASDRVAPITGFPVLVLKGERSGYIGKEDISDILKFFPAAEIIVIPNAGHWLHVDNPAAVEEGIRLLADGS